MLYGVQIFCCVITLQIDQNKLKIILCLFKVNEESSHRQFDFIAFLLSLLSGTLKICILLSQSYFDIRAVKY
jgi:hypothetical protein